MAYDDQQIYNKYQKKSCGHTHEGCGCKQESNPECGCCPPGLVAMYNSDGKMIGCVTPNDAQDFQTATNKMCGPGYIALYDKSTTPYTFLGCVTESEYAAANESVNGAPHVDPTGLSIIPLTETVAEGGTIQFYPQFVPADTTEQAVTWISTDETKATVDASGLVTGVAAGVTTIKATSVENVLIYSSRVLTVTP